MFILVTTLISITALQAQVTIGNLAPPKEGALLDLKTKQDGMSDQGLALPRVKLIKLADTDISKTIRGVTANSYTGDHTGLVVYHVADGTDDYCTGGAIIFPGVYVWHGQNWEYLGNNYISKNVYILTDERDEESYLVGNFGDAGDWMIENLRYKTGLTISNASDTYTTKSYFYPQPLNGSQTDPANIPSYYERQGVLYTWAAATNGENTSSADQGQVAGTTPGGNEVENAGPSGVAPKKYVQGICPPGWHLPSDREWNELEKAIYTDPKKYSTVTQNFNPANWDSSWETGTTGTPIYWRPDDSDNSRGQRHGTAMKSVCVLSGHSHGSPYGSSNSIILGGFEALLTGFAYKGKMATQEAGLSGLFGDSAYFWTSSSHDGQRAWRRTLTHERIGVLRGSLTSGANKDWLMSVRCKKNP